MDLHIENGDFPVRYVNVYQRVDGTIWPEASYNRSLRTLPTSVRATRPNLIVKSQKKSIHEQGNRSPLGTGHQIGKLR